MCIHIQDILKGYSERPNVLGKNAYHFISKVMDLILNLAVFPNQLVDNIFIFDDIEIVYDLKYIFVKFLTSSIAKIHDVLSLVQVSYVWNEMRV